jgi:hypothetical protein
MTEKIGAAGGGKTMKKVGLGIALLGLAAGLYLAAAAGAAPDQVIRELDVRDCRVMELYLRHQGQRVQVEGGRLKLRNWHEVRAELDCRSENGGVVFTWDLPLGDLGQGLGLRGQGPGARGQGGFGTP